MFCPYCHSEDTKVVDKRDNSDNGVTRRRRECIDCNKRFTTYERIEEIKINIEKRSGDIVDFDRSKLKSSILKSLKKRPISESQVDEIIDNIESKILTLKNTIIKSTQIGDMVLNYLKSLDKIAYLRFASVYRDFDTIEKFKKEIESLEIAN